MTISRMLPDRKPLVEERNDWVAIWDADDADPVGLLMSPSAAIDSGFALLAEAARQREDGPIVPEACSIQIEVGAGADVEEDVVARLVLDLEGAPLAIPLSATQLAEFAAALSAVSREVG